MMKVFISQPMKGKTDEQILTERNGAISKIERVYPDSQIEVIDSFFADYDGNAVQFLGKSILKLGEADLIVFLPGWDKARGCLVEEEVAKLYEIERLYV